MHVVPTKPYQDYESSVSPKGQITIPLETRKQLGIQPKDKVTIRVFEDGQVNVLAKKVSFLESYRTVAALTPPRTMEEIRAIAREDHIEETAHKGW